MSINNTALLTQYSLAHIQKRQSSSALSSYWFEKIFYFFWAVCIGFVTPALMSTTNLPSLTIQAREISSSLPISTQKSIDLTQSLPLEETKIQSVPAAAESIAAETLEQAAPENPQEKDPQPAEIVVEALDTPEPSPTPDPEPECKLADSFTPQVKHWEEEICRWSTEHQLDPDLIATLMQIESCGNSKAVSATGVRGLFQVTGANLDGQNPFNPDVSMAKGPGKVLKNELRATNGDIRAAMAGYNGGGLARKYIAGDINREDFISSLRAHGSGLWRSNSKALAKVNEVERYAQWSGIYFEAKENKSETLNEWLDLGGSRLCNHLSEDSSQSRSFTLASLMGIFN